MGIYGTVYPGDVGVLDYELYVVNGFNEGVVTSMRSGRGSQKSDNNDQKSLTGRINFSPLIGVQMAGSFHVGAYDDAGDHNLGIYAVDANFNRGPFEVRGEWAMATVDGAAHDERTGYYAQVGYHFGAGTLEAFPHSIFTASLRYDSIDLGASEERRTTLGLNWRPVEETAVKLDYESYQEDDQKSGLVFPSHLTFKGALIALLLGLYGVSPAIAQKTGSIRVYAAGGGACSSFSRGGALRVGCAHAERTGQEGSRWGLGRSFSGDSLVVDLAYDDEGKLLGYAVVSEEIGKFRPITFIVGVEPDFSVRGAGVLVYRESYGAEVRKKRFLRQYVGKTQSDPIRINRDIVNISGATMSVRALNFGVRKVLALTEHFYHTPQSAMHP